MTAVKQQRLLFGVYYRTAGRRRRVSVDINQFARWLRTRATRWSASSAASLSLRPLPRLRRLQRRQRLPLLPLLQPLRGLLAIATVPLVPVVPAVLAVLVVLAQPEVQMARGPFNVLNFRPRAWLGCVLVWSRIISATSSSSSKDRGMDFARVVCYNFFKQLIYGNCLI